MKFALLIGDGMADDPLPELGGRTPLEAARTPNLDRIANQGRVGLARTVPPGMEPGSDVAIMSILGYDPKKFYTGRAAIEAAALGVSLSDDQVAFRCNLVTIGRVDGRDALLDYSAGHPAAEEQAEIIDSLNKELGNENLRFFPGVSFRNLLVVSGFQGSPLLRAPHDHAGAALSEILPSGEGSEFLMTLMDQAREILEAHPVNERRRAEGRPPVNGIWLWGMGRAAKLPGFREMRGLSGAAITGVDLVRGLALLTGLEVIEVPGATGYVDTDYEGKARAALAALEEADFVLVHVEAPDEAGHQGDPALKVKAIEDFDRKTAGVLLEGLRKFPDYRVLLLPDHETPCQQRGHRGGPVPFAAADKAALEGKPRKGPGFSESAAKAAHRGEPLPGPDLLAKALLSKMSF